MEGWIKLYRSLLEHPRAGDPVWMAVWMRVLLSAAYRLEDEVWFGGRKITLKKGQLVVSVRELSKAVGADYSRVRRCLGWMVEDGQLQSETDGVNSLLSIVNWDKYQSKTGDAANGAGGDAANGAGGDAANGAGGKSVIDFVKSICKSKKKQTAQVAAQVEAQQTAQVTAQVTAQPNKIRIQKEEEEKSEPQERLEFWKDLHTKFCAAHPQAAKVPEMAFWSKCRCYTEATDEVLTQAVEMLGMDWAGSAFTGGTTPLRAFGWCVERIMGDKDRTWRPGKAAQAEADSADDPEKRRFKGYAGRKDEEG